MDEPIDAPEPPDDLPEELIDAVDDLSTDELVSLVSYARARVDYFETPIAELIEPEDDEEIVRIDEYDLYTVVVKGERCEAGCEECPHDPHVYVVTVEREVDGGRHLRWEDLGPMLG